jgi:hypothetical protein
MLTHVVCFQFPDPADADEAVRRLAAMGGRIPALLGIDVGRDVTRSERSYDVALVTRHADLAGMRAYQVHPVHQEVVAWIRSRGPKMVAVDFEA